MPIEPRQYPVARNLLGVALRFLLEREHAILRVDLEDAEAPRLALRDLDRADRELRAALDVLAEHAAVVHLVDVVARQDQHLLRRVFLEQVDVLRDRVGRALVPLADRGVVRRGDADELLQRRGRKFQPKRMCSSRLRAWYCVRT
jgi:hypothetical protein